MLKSRQTKIKERIKPPPKKIKIKQKKIKTKKNPKKQNPTLTSLTDSN